MSRSHLFLLLLRTGTVALHSGTWFSTVPHIIPASQVLSKTQLLDSGISDNIDTEKISQMEILLEGEGTLTFWWKVSSGSDEELQFILDGVLEDYMDGKVGWHQKTYPVTGSGTHSFLWQYVKDDDDESDDGYDCGFVDYVQWTGSPPSQGTSWDEITYTYEPGGRRIEKDVDGDTTTYVYKGVSDIENIDYSNKNKLLACEFRIYTEKKRFSEKLYKMCNIRFIDRTQTAGTIVSIHVVIRIRERKITLRTEVPKLSLS